MWEYKPSWGRLGRMSSRQVISTCLLFYLAVSCVVVWELKEDVRAAPRGVELSSPS